jgi:hypothetical protein
LRIEGGDEGVGLKSIWRVTSRCGTRGGRYCPPIGWWSLTSRFLVEKADPVVAVRGSQRVSREGAQVSYNPFEKAIGEPLDLNDLQSLVGRVAEGYYVEYKSTFPANDKVGHSIASFANTHGGWYLVGVEANTRTNLPESVPGIDLGRFPDPISKVRDIARGNIAPMPLLLPQLVPIRDKLAALAVYVPESDDTPHLTQDGRVYRRQADSSAPIPETDRLALDRLYERGSAATQQFDRFCEDPRNFSGGQIARSWAEIYLSPLPTGSVHKADILRSEYLDELLSASRQPIEVSLSDKAKATAWGLFNHVHTCSGSVILRQAEPAYLAFNTLELELFTNGRGRMFLPLARLKPAVSMKTMQSERALAALQEMVQSEAAATLSLLSLVDLVQTSRELGYLVVFYLRWLDSLGWRGDLLAKVRLSNVWCTVPFFDTDGWGECVERFGLPVCNRSSIMMPPEGSKPLRVECREETGAPVVELFGMLAVALGLPSDQVLRLLEVAWTSDG